MMKKIVAFAVGALLLSSVSFGDSTIRIQIDDKPLALEVPPTIENGRTLVPFRAIFEALGLQVDWNDELRIATAYNDIMNVSVKPDGTFGSVNGELKALDALARIEKERMLVPLRFISEAFGNEVAWDAAERIISIKSGFKPYAYTEALPVVGSLDKLKLILDYAGKYNQPVYRTMDSVTTDSSEKSAAPAAPSAAGADHSSTNVQVAGVDEGDIVKTDGLYIYQLRSNDLKITRTDGAALQTVSTLNFDKQMNPAEFYLYGQKLIVIGTKQQFVPYDTPDMPQVRMIMPPMQSPKTQVIFYDISNPEKPQLVRSYESDGSYLTSRLTGGKLYLVANKYLNVYGLKDDEILPTFRDSLTGKTQTLGYDQIRYFPDTVESNLMITLGFNLDNMTAEPDKGIYLGSGSTVYASTDSLYVSMNRYHYRIMTFAPEPSFEQTTEIFKFGLADGKVQFKAKGSVPGTIINQFSMDSQGSTFRIATTSGEAWNTGENTSKNNIYVLNSSMAVQGKLEGLAPGERIYSVRFLGDRAYMVTFRQVDPFYVIDLKNPSAPSVLGYLKIPGFSEYLHPYDSNTIIGFGKETVQTKNGVMTEGLKIGMFDVSDVQNPVEKHKLILGGAGSWSDVLSNHKALLFSREKNLFALPVTLYETQNGMNQFTWQGAHVYTIDPVKGFTLRGTSTHLSDQEIANAGIQWYDSQKNIQRIIYIGDSIYTLSNYGIKGHDLDTMKYERQLNYE